MLDVLQSGRGEPIKPDDPRIAGAQTRMIATPHIALDAAAAIARPAGVAAHILGNAIEGGTREVGKVMTGIALQVAERGQPFHSPCVLLSGGETTVTLSGQGRGGCNVEFLLSLGVALNGHPRIHALAGDTDGVDRQEEIAGALLTPDSMARARDKASSPRTAWPTTTATTFFKPWAIR